VFVADDKDHVTSPLPVQTEREKEVVQQLKQEIQWYKLLTEFVDFKKYYNSDHGRCVCVCIKSAVEKALKSTRRQAK